MSRSKFVILLAVLTVVSVPTVSFWSLGAVLTREEVQQKLSAVIEDTKQTNRESAALVALETKNKKVLQQTTSKLKQVEDRKKDVETRLAAAREAVRIARQEADLAAQDEVRALQAYAVQRKRLSEFVRGSYTLTRSEDTGPRYGRLLYRRLFRTSLGETVQAERNMEAISRARAQIVVSLYEQQRQMALHAGPMLTTAVKQEQDLLKLEEENRKVQEEFKKLATTQVQAETSLKLSQQEIAEVQREYAAVQSQVLRMQGEMARIEARLQSKAERALVQLGLRNASPGRYSEKVDTRAMFVWPVSGRKTAGFRDASYKSYFGIPHNGQDIAVPQNTPVGAAADGVVFLARDGGAKGFSYILIGHRDGYATLYGHMSQFSVQAGQEVKRGQVIGLSGGTPGTHGAGPMTTGAHLHFEMIRNGVHINPSEVMP